MQPQHQQTTVITVPSQPVQYVVSTPAAGPKVYPKFPKKQAIASGTLLIVAALLSIVFNIVELAVSNNDDTSYRYLWIFGYVGHGFWVSVMCIIPGALGISAGKSRTKCLVNAFNTMCIIAASFAAIQFAIALAGAIVGPHCFVYYYFYDRYNYNDYYVTSGCPKQFRVIDVAMEALLTAMALVEAAVAIWGSAICCRTTCCCSCCLAEPRPVATVSGSQPYSTQLMVISNNQQIQPQVIEQGFSNIAYQPGYPGQPTQFTAMPVFYPPQGQFIPPAVQSPPPYINVPQNFQMNAQPMNQQIAGPHATAPVQTALTEEHKWLK